MKLLKDVPLKVIECKKSSNTFLPHIHFIKKGQFLDQSPCSTGRGEIFHFIVNVVKSEIYPQTDPAWAVRQQLHYYYVHVVLAVLHIISTLGNIHK